MRCPVAILKIISVIFNKCHSCLWLSVVCHLCRGQGAWHNATVILILIGLFNISIKCAVQATRSQKPETKSQKGVKICGTNICLCVSVRVCRGVSVCVCVFLIVVMSAKYTGTMCVDFAFAVWRLHAAYARYQCTCRKRGGDIEGERDKKSTGIW